MINILKNLFLIRFHSSNIIKKFISYKIYIDNLMINILENLFYMKSILIIL